MGQRPCCVHEPEGSGKALQYSGQRTALLQEKGFLLAALENGV